MLLSAACCENQAGIAGIITMRWLFSSIILMRNNAGRHLHIIYWFIQPLNILSENNNGQMIMKEKKVDKKKTLAYAVAFLLYGCIYQVHDGRYDV